MDFIPITINEYVALHKKNNPSTNEVDLRRNLETALTDYNNMIKCSCGEDIWVIGSASVGNSCYTCITGESISVVVFEIDSAILKNRGEGEEADLDDDIFDFMAGGSYWDDDGNQINPDLYPLPSMCLACKNNSRKSQKVLCTLNRIGLKDGEEFKCGAFDPI